MKNIILFCLFSLAINNISLAQNTVNDSHPGSCIFVIQNWNGNEVLANYNAAILFKDAFIDLVGHTRESRDRVAATPGRQFYVIMQLDPQTNGNAYQLVLFCTQPSQVITVYTFVYNADQNALSLFDPVRQSYFPVAIEGPNMVNLNNCFNLGRFNAPPAPQPVTYVDADDNAPVDANVSIEVTPPALPEYEQPACPQEGYLWQPGYWAYRTDGNGYYWVPGAWVAPPNTGLVWTPPYWAFEGRFFVFHAGYWGPTIGFYGGVYYGHGYGGHGYNGGEWRDGHYRYNTAVVNVNETVVHTTYIDRTVIVNNVVINHTSFNGPGGVAAKPDEHEMAAAHEQHVAATPEQIRNQRIAREDKSQFAAANGGKPASLAAPHVPEKKPDVGVSHGPVTNPVTVGAKPGAPEMKPGAAAPKPGSTPGAATEKPGTAQEPKSTPATAGTKPGEAVTTTKPGEPATTPKPGEPATTAKPGEPVATTVKPGAPGATGAKPGATGKPKPGKPTKPGGRDSVKSETKK